MAEIQMAGPRHDNNFDFLRLVAALMVIYSHAFVMVGLPQPPALGLTTVGPLAVYIFFGISGYLVTQSWLSDPHPLRYLQRRGLRIFPALIVVVLLAIFVLGPVETTLPIGAYFRDGKSWGYARNLILHPDYYLPGVFTEGPVPNTVNVTLWSLPVEFGMYLAVMAVGLVRLFGYRWVVLALSLAAGAGTLWLQAAHPGVIVVYGVDAYQAAYAIPYFLGGMCLYLFRDRLPRRTAPVLLAFAILLALPSGRTLIAWSWFALPFVVLGFCLAGERWLVVPRKFGDLSYGIYIYGFPMQQIVYRHLHKTWGLYPMMLLSLLLAAGCAFASWHLVEAPALKLKPRTRVAAAPANP